MFKDFHVCIQVSDMDRSRSFYQELGFSPLVDRQYEDGQVIWQYLRHSDSGTLLELLQFTTVAATAQALRDRRSLLGLNHIGFHVEDLDQLRSKLESLGAEIVEQGGRPSYRFLFGRGPDGELLGFAEFDR